MSARIGHREAFLSELAQSRQNAKLFSSRRNWYSPNPSPAGKCAPPSPFGSGGRGTLAGKRGDGRVPIPTRGQTLVLCIYMYFVILAQVPVSSQGTPTDQNAHQLEWERGELANILTMESGGWGGGKGEGDKRGQPSKKKRENVIDMEKFSGENQGEVVVKHFNRK